LYIKAYLHSVASPVELDTVKIGVSTSNTAPAVSNVSLNSGSNISLIENSTKAVDVTATVTDSQGCSTISTVQAKIFRSSLGSSCASDYNNCYTVESCTQDNGSCSGAGDNDATYTCSFNVYYFAEPTDEGSPNASDTWQAWVQATDNGSLTGSNTNSSQSIELNTFQALDVSSTLSYGSMAPGDTSSTLNKTVTITNTGNSSIDIEISGTDMSKGNNTIAVNKQKYSISAGTIYDNGTSLSETPTKVVIDLTKPISTAPITATFYWGVAIPEGIAYGSYTGTQTYTAVSD